MALRLAAACFACYAYFLPPYRRLPGMPLLALGDPADAPAVPQAEQGSRTGWAGKAFCAVALLGVVHGSTPVGLKFAVVVLMAG
ncbi:hypothetical protein [Thiolapillus sp.]